MEQLAAITLKPSRIARYVQGCVLLLSMLSILLCGLSALIKLLLIVVLFGAGLRQIQKQKHPELSAIGFEQEQWWALVQNRKIIIELVNEQLVLPWLIVLNFRVNESGEKDSGKKYALALWPDMAHADDLRRLRVQLRNG